MSKLTPEQRLNLHVLVAALRSGRYQQTRGVLRRYNCFCVLGVACDVAIKRHVPVRWSNDRILDLTSLEDSRNSLTRSVREFYGLTSIGILGDVCLSQLNDRGVPFDGIANVLEKELKCTL